MKQGRMGLNCKGQIEIEVKDLIVGREFISVGY